MGRRKGSLNKPKNQGPGGTGLKPGDPNPPWDPAPAQDIETVSMFQECENGHMSYRTELQNAPCKICGAGAGEYDGDPF